MENTKQILIVPDTTHPKAEIQSVDAVNGVVLFAWCDINGNRTDSGNSIGRFQPTQLAPVPPATVGEYAEPSDATLINAIRAVV